MSYDFSTLNVKDLEELAIDLLNAELNLGLQSFKVGKDGGIDLRYSSPENNNEIVVQVKHYLKSGESKLIADFKDKELSKVKKLKLNRYIIVTSIPTRPREAAFTMLPRICFFELLFSISKAKKHLALALTCISLSSLLNSISFSNSRPIFCL
jgi:hypothetical protein